MKLRLVVFGAIVLHLGGGIAHADDIKDCSRGRAADVRLAACTRIVESPVYGDGQKAIAYHNRGELRLAAGNTDEAFADYSKAIDIAPDVAGSYAGRARALLVIGAINAAIADFTSAMKHTGSESALAPLLIGRGHAYVVAGKPDLAIADLDAAIKINPSSASAHNHRGLAYRRKGDNARAIDDYSAAISLNPIYSLAYNNRGYVYESLGRREEAIADFSRALLLDSSLTGASDGLKRLQANGILAVGNAKMIAAGEGIALTSCSFCHAVGRSGDSPLAKAPPFRRLASRHPGLTLREPLSRGIAAQHDEMPRFEFSNDEIDGIIAYINSL